MDGNGVFGLQGQTAVITGGATGLGFAMANCLTAAGARVVIVGIEGEDVLAGACEALGPNAFFYRCDITDTDRLPDLTRRIIREHGDVGILINNAGIHCKKPIEDMTVEDFTAVLNVHIVASFALTRALVPHMKANGAGSVLFISSMTGFLGQPYVTGYSAAKSAVLGMVRTLATELSPFGIRVNAIAPGWIETPMLRRALDGDPERRDKILGRTPMQKFGKPEDIGWAAVYLCSEAAAFVNGTSLVVDGGALIGF